MGPPFRVVSICRGGGYRYAKTEPLHPKANSKGLYPLHRVLIENSIGRLLENGEVVHHVDGDKTNDSLENLMLLGNPQHAALHSEVPMVTCVCEMCGDSFLLKPSQYRLRMNRSKYGAIFCSRLCGARHQHS